MAQHIRRQPIAEENTRCGNWGGPDPRLGAQKRTGWPPTLATLPSSRKGWPIRAGLRIGACSLDNGRLRRPRALALRGLQEINAHLDLRLLDLGHLALQVGLGQLRARSRREHVKGRAGGRARHSGAGVEACGEGETKKRIRTTTTTATKIIPLTIVIITLLLIPSAPSPSLPPSSTAAAGMGEREQRGGWKAIEREREREREGQR